MFDFYIHYFIIPLCTLSVLLYTFINQDEDLGNITCPALNPSILP